jgi:hypothetical protein
VTSAPALAAHRASELVFEIGQPDIAILLIGAYPDPVRAVIIAAVDQQAAHAHVADFATAKWPPHHQEVGSAAIQGVDDLRLYISVVDESGRRPRYPGSERDDRTAGGVQLL